MKLKSTLLVIGAFLVMSANAQKAQWNLDKSHSSIGFSIDHMVVSETVGQFNEYSMNVKADKADFTDAEFDVTIQVKSIDTKDKKRDGHLLNKDFFDAVKFPTIIFKGMKFQKVSSKKYKVVGDMTMHGITKKVTLDAKFGGIVKDPWGNTRAGLKIWGEINRYDFDLKYNSALEAGGLTIGKEVRLECRIELTKAK